MASGLRSGCVVCLQAEASRCFDPVYLGLISIKGGSGFHHVSAFFGLFVFAGLQIDHPPSRLCLLAPQSSIVRLKFIRQLSLLPASRRVCLSFNATGFNKLKGSSLSGFKPRPPLFIFYCRKYSINMRQKEGWAL